MKLAQRRVRQRVGLMIGRNRDDDRPVDLADGELVGCKPAEIENVGCGIEVILELVPQFQTILIVATGRLRVDSEVRPT